jgi:probable selenium-dependent hydroxylase accessory protein YqeC
VSQPIDLARFAATLKIPSHSHISLVGGGGKTTLLFALAGQLAGSVALSTTTKMGVDRTNGHRVLIDPTDEELKDALSNGQPILVWQATDGHKALGVDPSRCDRWFGAVADHVVVEADGSRRKPFKAPAEYEPVIAASTTLVISCIGVAALGLSIADGCHRPELVAALADCAIADRLTPQRAATVISHPQGGRRNIPSGSRYVVALNRMAPTDADGFALAETLHDLGIEVVCVAERAMS